MNARIAMYPELASVIDRVPDADIAGCLHLLALATVSVVGYHAPELDEALDELRDRGGVCPANRLAVNSLFAQREQYGFAAGRRGNVDAREKTFFEARAIKCAAYAVGSVGGSPRDRLQEAAYEAVAAFRGTSGVLSVLTRYAG